MIYTQTKNMNTNICIKPFSYLFNALKYIHISSPVENGCLNISIVLEAFLNYKISSVQKFGISV